MIVDFRIIQELIQELLSYMAVNNQEEIKKVLDKIEQRLYIIECYLKNEKK